MGVLASLVALIGGGLITVQAWLTESAPQTSAVAYFRALARDDAAAALALGNVPSGVRTYLTREVLQASLDIAKISNVRVLSVHRSGGTADVTLQYQLDYKTRRITVTDKVSAVRHGRSWRLTTTAAPVHLRVQSGANRMSIAGTPVPKQTVLFFAGALPVNLDTPNLDIGMQVVHLNGSVLKAIQPRVTPAGNQAVGAAIEDVVARCARGQASARCPQPADSRLVPGSLRGTLSVNDLTITVDKLNANGLLRITGTAAVTGSYQELNFENVPETKPGTLELPIDARCYATDPGQLDWKATT